MEKEIHDQKSMTKVILLDDEEDLREEVALFLRQRGGFDVTEVGTIRQFYQFFRPDVYDIVILDAMLPDGDGAVVAEEVNLNHPRCGVVMFTARDSTRDRINGYRVGVDHYVTKPVRMEELLAILQSLSRRVCEPKVWSLRSADRGLRSPKGIEIPLTSLEYKFMSILNARPGTPVMRRLIIEALGKDISSYDDRNLDALVLRLRRKVQESTQEPFPLKTVHGSGYSLAFNVLEK